MTPTAVYHGGPQQLALNWRGQGTGHNGVAVEFDGIDVVTLDSAGKILRLEAYWDATPTLSKLIPSS